MHLQVRCVVLKIKFANFLKFTQRNVFLHMSINPFEIHWNIGDIAACTDTAQPRSYVFQQQGKCCKSNHFCIFIRDSVLCNARANGITSARTKIIRMDALAEFRITQTPIFHIREITFQILKQVRSAINMTLCFLYSLQSIAFTIYQSLVG